MISREAPSDWQDLQSKVAQLLQECGFSVEIEKTIRTPRGSITVDVYAEETIKGRKYIVLCECKHWKRKVPQQVAHAFRTQVAEVGANVGYIVAAEGFQVGAMAAVEYTNLRLVTWAGFQEEFQETWLENYLVPFVTERFAEFMEFVEPLRPRGYGLLSEGGKARYDALAGKHLPLGAFLMLFTTWTRAVFKKPPPSIPIAEDTKEEVRRILPPEVLAAADYRTFLEVAGFLADEAVLEFRALLAHGRSGP